MQEKSFEENLKNLEELVKELEGGNVPLEDAIKKYTEAMELAKVCSDTLDNATESVNKILNKDGNLENFDVKESD